MLSEKQKAIALKLAIGTSQREAARLHGIHHMTIQGWKRNPEFVEEMDRLREVFLEAAVQAEQKG